MNVHHELTRESTRPLVLAIGFFDGFHRGHRELARRALRLRRPGWRCGLLTFENHPATHLRPGSEPDLLCTPQERLELFGRAGFEECFFVPFDERIATLSPDEFLQLLLEHLHVAAVVVGTTFRFGHKRTGDVAVMTEFLERHGASAVAVSPVCDGGERISSTRIRTLVRDGELVRADELLGGTGYELRGPVEVGAGRGHALGFPTANLRVPGKLLPKDGVYAATARYDGRDYAALVSIGSNPQFGGGERTVEAWLRDFQLTIYGRELALRDFRYLREQRLFAGVGELVKQMQCDLQAIGYPSYG
ncbi:MAG: riboflavin biosynthesis protein RibF [Candidatus Eremiobacteraeota bacterium]|nr:riboflavin biosynthesis protein RibF [Candidatus Eremiobacteraeota bacterium]